MLVYFVVSFFFFFKQKTAYEMRISDWSSDVCSSDLVVAAGAHAADGDGEDAVPTHLGDRVEDRVARTFGCLRWSGDESENCAEPDGYRPAKGPARLLRLDLAPGAAAPRCGSRAQVSASWHDFSVPPGRDLERLDEA